METDPSLGLAQSLRLLSVSTQRFIDGVRPPIFYDASWYIGVLVESGIVPHTGEHAAFDQYRRLRVRGMDFLGLAGCVDPREYLGMINQALNEL
ncbi:hypothetical protein KC992_01195 [Candidatus Saccharibacteria bacterium]|nr:hypothetical protein [Candidatus Saccharibacteria bacterium]MCA9328875.1 hypothetical protein [Candidatus Saccharibacteria bacterium]